MLRKVLIKNYQQANEFESRGADVSLLLVTSLFDALRKWRRSAGIHGR